MNFKYVRNHDEYLLFVEQMKYNFGYIHDWADFFGIKDINFIKGLKVFPPEYPCFLYCNFIDKTVHPRARVIDFLPVSYVINNKYKNWYKNLSMVINEDILVDGVELLGTMLSDKKRK